MLVSLLLQRLDRHHDAALLGLGGDALGELDQLLLGLVLGEAVGHLARPAAAEDDGLDAQHLGRGRTPGSTYSSCLALSTSGPTTFSSAGRKLLATGVGMPTALCLAWYSANFASSRRGEVAHAELDVVEAGGLGLLEVLAAEPIGHLGGSSRHARERGVRASDHRHDVSFVMACLIGRGVSLLQRYTAAGLQSGVKAFASMACAGGPDCLEVSCSVLSAVSREALPRRQLPAPERNRRPALPRVRQGGADHRLPLPPAAG